MNASSTPAAPPPHRPTRRRRERLGLFLLVIGGFFAAAGVVLFRHHDRAVGLVQREDLARAGVVLLAGAQAGFHERTGHYGWVEDLQAAGLLEGLDVVVADDVVWIRTPGYRLDVLLPHANLGGGEIGIVPADDERSPDEMLQRKHFAVVARPLHPGRSGHRMWYVDQRGEMYLNEGVIDDDGALLNALPERLVRGSMSLDTASLLLWQREVDVRPDLD